MFPFNFDHANLCYGGTSFKIGQTFIGITFPQPIKTLERNLFVSVPQARTLNWNTQLFRAHSRTNRPTHNLIFSKNMKLGLWGSLIA